MLPLNHHGLHALLPPIFFVTKKFGNKNKVGSPFLFSKKYKITGNEEILKHFFEILKAAYCW